MKKLIPAAFILVLFAYLTLSVSSALTLLPNVDEAWFTSPGYNLVTKGFFGTTVLDETAVFRKVKLDGINRSTYWIMPVYPLLQAATGKVFGFGLVQTRAVSIFFGLIALLGWACLVKKLSNSSFTAMLAVGLMAVDFIFVYAASEGRMDMMTAALGVSGLAVFAWMREKGLDRAVLIASTLTALSFFTHPLGMMWAVSLAILIALLDLRQIRFRHLALAALPFVILGLGWFIYISQAPELFSKQFGGNASDRWGFFAAPLAAFWKEIELRYLYNFGVGEGLGGAGRVKVVVLACFVLAIAGAASVKTLRKEPLPLFMLILAAQQFVMLMLLDGMKQHYYLVHIVPTLTVIMAVWMIWLWSQTKPAKALALGMFALVIIVNVGVNVLRIKRNAYGDNYTSVTTFLNKNVRASDVVMGSAELWFGMERKETLVDDYRLGYLSGKGADLIVIDAPRYKDWIGNLKSAEPQTHSFIHALLQDKYSIVYEDSIYQVFRVKE